MDCVDAVIRIIENNNCPLYQLKDEFLLSGRSLTLPPDKPACLTLTADIKEALNVCESLTENDEENPSYSFNCSGYSTGCQGIIGLEYQRETDAFLHATITSTNRDIDMIVGLLSKFSIFQTLDEKNIKELLSFLMLKSFSPDDVILKKGDPGRNLFIVVSGKIEVIGDEDVHLAFLGRGEVFGEMSLLSGEPVGATIKVVEPTTVLYMNGKDFRIVLNKFPSLQMYFARLLARRLSNLNIVRSQEYASGMTGKLADMSPSELFQTLHVNQKTGILTLKLPKGKAELLFREGDVLNVKYNGKEGREAFYETLKEKSGIFKFTPGLPPAVNDVPEMGDFMWLLMEGIRQMDENRVEQA